LRIIDENGDNLGEMTRDEALALARQKELDLIEIAPDARPPVCKILDWGKFQYEQEKEERKQKAKNKQADLKEIRLTFKIGQHDLEIRQQQIAKFLEKGHKVRINMKLRGREMAHQFAAREKIANFVKSLGEGVKQEGPIDAKGNNLQITVYKK